MNISRTFGFILGSILLLTNGLSAQKSESIKVLAGLKVEDCIPFQKRYRFPEFTTGTVLFKSGSHTESKLNYNFLMREMEYIDGKDTLAIANAASIQQIIISDTVFIFNKGYLELIYNGKVTVLEKEYYNLIDVRKKDPYGDIGSGAATDSYSSLYTDGQAYKLTANHDMIFQKATEYYLGTSPGNIVLFNKKKVKQLFPQQKKAINAYLKSSKVNFNSRIDIIRFAEYLEDL